MIGFGIVLFVFILLAIIDILFRYIKSGTGYFNAISLILPVILFMFFAFIGAIVHVIGNNILHVKEFSDTGLILENLFGAFTITSVFIFALFIIIKFVKTIFR